MTLTQITNTELQWCDRSRLIASGLPVNWIHAFRANHPNDTRKLGKAKQSRRLYRISAINAAIESEAANA